MSPKYHKQSWGYKGTAFTDVKFFQFPIWLALFKSGLGPYLTWSDCTTLEHTKMRHVFEVIFSGRKSRTTSHGWRQRPRCSYLIRLPNAPVVRNVLSECVITIQLLIQRTGWYREVGRGDQKREKKKIQKITVIWSYFYIFWKVQPCLYPKKIIWGENGPEDSS